MAGKATLAACGLALAALTGAVGARLPAQTTGDNPGQAPTSVDAATGAQVYGEICAGCHMAQAEGGTGAGAIPALAKNPHLADADFVVTTLLKGRGGMPAFNGVLEPAQIAGVATHIRTHYGNGYTKPVTVQDVKRLSVGLDPAS